MSLNYNIFETFKLLLDCFKYDMFIAILISSVLFIVLMLFNKKDKYIVLGINLILVILISYYYINDILTFEFNNVINNMYFYFFNSIIYLIIMTVFNFKFNYKKINYIFYGLSIINILYSIFMTHYLNNIKIIIIGNIFPMIKFGNIIYFIYYIIIIIIILRKAIKRFLTKNI